MPEAFTFARCHFYLRTGTPGAYEYTSIRIPTRDGTGMFPTAVPPQIGDIVLLPTTGRGGCGRVIERQWLYPAYGSMAWPSGRLLEDGVLLTVILEEAEGVFRGEAPTGQDDDELECEQEA